MTDLDRQFTPEDREHVRAVFLAALDEMDDSYSLAGMFGPNAELITIALRTSHP